MQQGSLFDLITSSSGATSGIAGLMPAIRAIMCRVAKEYEPGRKMLADAISEVAARENVALTSGGAKALDSQQLDKWLQPKAQGHAPTLEGIACFCLAVEDWSPLQPLFAAFGLTVIPKSDLAYLEYGKTCDALKKAREQKKRLENNL